MVSINLLRAFNTMYKINIVIVMIYFKKKAGSVRLHGPKDYCAKK